jgi:hypothetical protein
MVVGEEPPGDPPGWPDLPGEPPDRPGPVEPRADGLPVRSPRPVPAAAAGFVRRHPDRPPAGRTARFRDRLAARGQGAPGGDAAHGGGTDDATRTVELPVQRDAPNQHSAVDETAQP